MLKRDILVLFFLIPEFYVISDIVMADKKKWHCYDATQFFPFKALTLSLCMSFDILYFLSLLQVKKKKLKEENKRKALEAERAKEEQLLRKRRDETNTERKTSRIRKFGEQRFQFMT